MEYELFRKLVVRRIKEFLPPMYQDFVPELNLVPKVNEIKDAFCMKPPGDRINMAIPTLYLDDIYIDFAQDQDLDRILARMAQVIVSYSGIEVPELASFRLEDHTDLITANLISRAKNEMLLDRVPFTPFLDMAVIYRIVHSAGDDGIHSAIITNDMLESTELTTEDLHEFALRNTPRIFPPRILDGSEEGVFILTNHNFLFGATAMLFDGEMRRLSGLVGGDFYIMPTSLHEFFAISTELADPEDLKMMLAEGNRQITAPVDRLSTGIYHYLSSEGRIISEGSLEN